MRPDRAHRETLSLARPLAARLLPLALVLFSVIAVSAPIAIFSLRLQEIRDRAAATAREVAAWIRQEARERPELWKYDTLKIVAQLRSYGALDVRHIAVLDEGGTPLDLGGDAELARLDRNDTLWGTARVVVDTEDVGGVWVAMSVGGARRNALLLLGLFGSLGALLAGLMYAIPLGVVAAAEERSLALVDRLEDSQRALAGLNRTLEDKVTERSHELRAAYRALQAKEHHLRAISSRAIAMQEAERRAIARELHDSAGQALTAIRIHLQLLAARAGTAELRDLAHKTLGLSDETLEEIRRAVRNLGPAILDDVGLAEAVRRYAEDFAERSRIAVVPAIDLGGATLSSAVESACYRIVQEGLTNVARHARATRVKLALHAAGDGLVLEIEDDGEGFDPEVAHGHGLAGIRERVELLGGAVAIASTRGGGTRLDVRLPLDQALSGEPHDAREG